MTVRRRRPRLFEERLAGIAGGAFLGSGGGRPRGTRPLNDGSGTPSLPYETEGEGGGGGEAAPVQADGRAVTVQTMGISWDVGPGVHEFYEFAGTSDTDYIVNPYSSLIGFKVGGLWTCSMQFYLDYSTITADSRFQIFDDSGLFVTPVFKPGAHPSGSSPGAIQLWLPQMTAFVQVEADATFYTQFYITVYDDSPLGGDTQHIEGLSMVFTLTLPQFAM